jgi:hypothetical protein
MLMPYEMRRSDFIHIAETYPVPQYQPVTPTSYSEEALHYTTLENRQREQKPPLVKDFPLGTWARNSSDFLFLLTEKPIQKIKLREIPDENLIEKYVAWYQEGSTVFPPVHGVETISRTIGLTDGHHRIKAQQKLGIQNTRIWLSLSLYRNLDGQLWADAISYPAITVLAARCGTKISGEVLQDALKDYLAVFKYLKEQKDKTFELKGHEGIISASTIEELARWMILESDYKFPNYRLKLTSFGKQIIHSLNILDQQT